MVALKNRKKETHNMAERHLRFIGLDEDGERMYIDDAAVYEPVFIDTGVILAGAPAAAILGEPGWGRDPR